MYKLRPNYMPMRTLVPLTKTAFIVFFFKLSLRMLVQSLLAKPCEANISIRSVRDLKMVSFFLKKDIFLQLDQLVDIFCVDLLNFKTDSRFELRYKVNSLFYNTQAFTRLRIMLYEKVFSLTKIIFSSNWLEREIWDMYGVFFLEHSDLRRILTDYGFSGHPLKKDFPLSGYMELAYSYSLKNIVYDFVFFMQSFRMFNQQIKEW